MASNVQQQQQWQQQQHQQQQQLYKCIRQRHQQQQSLLFARHQLQQSNEPNSQLGKQSQHHHPHHLHHQQPLKQQQQQQQCIQKQQQQQLHKLYAQYQSNSHTHASTIINEQHKQHERHEQQHQQHQQHQQRQQHRHEARKSKSEYTRLWSQMGHNNRNHINADDDGCDVSPLLKRKSSTRTPLTLIFRNHLSKFLTRASLTTFLQWSLFLLVFFSDANMVSGEGNVGCHFVRNLCIEGSEVCFNDNIFGKCIPTTGVDVEDIEKKPLTEEQALILTTMLEELQGAGLGWDHPFVQCRIQGTLFSLQKQTQLPPNLCANLAPNPTDFDPDGSRAFVRFTPPDENYYANEFHYPPLKKQAYSDGISTILYQLQMQDRQQRHDPGELEHFGKLDSHDTQIQMPNVMDAFLETERNRIEKEEMLRQAELEAQRKNVIRNRLELYQMLAASEPDPEPYQRKQPTAMDQLEKLIEHEQAEPIYPIKDLRDDSNELYFPENYASHKRTGTRGRKQPVKKLQTVNDAPLPHSFFRELAAEQVLDEKPNYNEDFYSHSLRSGPLEVDVMPTYKRISSQSRHEYQPLFDDNFQLDTEVDTEESDGDRKQRLFEESLLRNSLTPFEEEAMLQSNSYPNTHRLSKPNSMFTEGGLIYIPKQQQQQQQQQQIAAEELKNEKARELLANMFGFTRHERLDVKKPGPLIGPPPNAVGDLTKALNKTEETKAETKEILPQHIKGSNQAHKKKKIIKGHSDEDHAPHIVDTTYAHVYVKNPIDSWNDGVRIMNELANILHMQGYFTYLTVQPHEVSFRVDSNNPEHKTASDVARVINENRGVKNNILRRLGVTVLHAGVGDKIKRDEDYGVSSARIELAEQGPDVTHILAYMFAGAGAAAVIVIFVTLILIKRHDKKRDKLGGIQSGVGGAESCSKDYQDLCRARMAGKGNAGESVASVGRITSLSKENDRPPSSRSSTSSWSEEPALTNMDISTGHMVLSYMEDHLRNKGRLQREWEALCRYEAEPSAREAAQNPQCVNFNRPGAPLPYDHSRVVLNHLANEEGLDYVNASTITDHDPRAPAYVAAQGPMPTTLAHFWQMIWEQGAVVIVALCRLQENGEIACARYWPEEGAEVYHIYEVHLVSEHIWCEDYLVRSFYLKNLRTSETRTVTQFHFLSWPQNGVPPQAKALLDFRRKVNKSYRGRSCPIVVHGSSGAGRTGAYILLDLVLGRMNKGAREIDIAATLEHLRDQRAGLVATRQQFEFVLMAVAEEVHAILKALPANQSGEKRDLDAKEAAPTGTLKEEETTTTTTVAATTSTDVNEASTSKSAITKTNQKEEEATDKEKKKADTTSSTPSKPSTSAAGGKKK